MDTKKLTNKHPVDISKLSTDDMNVVIEIGYQDMLAGRMVPAKKAFVNIQNIYCEVDNL